jgi:hypothetical protein
MYVLRFPLKYSAIKVVDSTSGLRHTAFVAEFWSIIEEE